MRLGLVLCISNLLVLALPGPIQAQGDLVEDPSPLRVVIRGKPVRLEALTVRRADAAGRLPIALIAHGKPNTQGRMSDQHARDYLMQARDLARRGWLAVIVMRRGFGALAHDRTFVGSRGFGARVHLLWVDAPLPGGSINLHFGH